MDSENETDEVSETADIGERLRSWRVFLAHVRWSAAVAAVVLIALLVWRTHG